MQPLAKLTIAFSALSFNMSSLLMSVRSAPRLRAYLSYLVSTAGLLVLDGSVGQRVKVLPETQ
jgi:hypothetical protein